MDWNLAVEIVGRTLGMLCDLKALKCIEKGNLMPSVTVWLWIVE